MELLLSHQTQFVNIYSQIHRHTDPPLFMKSLQNLIVSLRKTIMTSQTPSVQKAHFTILKLLFKLMVYTRDIYGGLGERDLTYYMMFIWKYHFPVPTAYCLSKMITHTYGSWRDIKGFCEVIRKYSEKGDQDPFIETCIGLMNHQLNNDMIAWEKKCTSEISLVSKWIPRETSAHSWLFDRCAIQWIRAFRPQYLKTVGNCSDRFRRAFNKGKREYRRIFTTLSIACDTLEIKQCGNKWDSIDPKRIPMRAMTTQQRSLLNIGNTGNVRFRTAGNKDRESCAAKIQAWWLTTIANKKRSPVFIEMGSIIQQCLTARHPSEIYRMESLWTTILNQLPDMPKGMIPVLDTSLFHTDPDSFYHALGMALAISCKSAGGGGDEKRLLAFDKTARLVSLDGNLREMMETMKPIFREHHIGCDLKNAFNSLVGISNLDILVIFSSMNNTSKNLMDALSVFDNEPPSVMLWSEIGVCDTELLKSVPIFVGYGNETLRHIGATVSLKQMTPFVFIQYLLSNTRYDMFDSYFDGILRGA